MQTDILLVNKLLEGTNVSIIDAARLIRNILDLKRNDDSHLDNIQYCHKVINAGIKAYKKDLKEKTQIKAFHAYLSSKTSLGKESLKDIRYIGSRLFRICPQMKNTKFSRIDSKVCQDWLEKSFRSPSQFNKGRTFLSGFFSYAQKKRWIDKNPVSEISPKRTKETEIKALSLEEIYKLINTLQSEKHKDCASAFGIMLWAGVRPKEVSRLKWKDIDFEENIITIRSIASKTGGTRHIEMLDVLKTWLEKFKKSPEEKICPPNWIRKWKAMRDEAGFKGKWINDVLRHTFASYHLKYFKNMIRLQNEMGHRDLNLLRTRYVNMTGITQESANIFMNLHKTKFKEQNRNQ